jgi:Na+-driven multidrug efflux pump
LNLVLDVVLLFGWPAVGVPSCGPVGAAYATVAARAVAAYVAWRWLSRPQHRLSMRAVPLEPDERLGGALLVDAWPLVAQIGLRALPVLGLTALLQRRASSAEAVAFGIATRWDTVLLFGSLGFANAATAYVARAVAVGQRRNAVLAGGIAAVGAMGFSAAILIACQAAAGTIAGWFFAAPDAAVAAAFASYLGTAGWSQVLGAGALAAVGALHGAGRLRLPLVVDAVGFAWLLGCWWWLAADAGEIEATYRALVVGMAGLLVAHLVVVGSGGWLPKWRSHHA